MPRARSNALSFRAESAPLVEVEDEQKVVKTIRAMRRASLLLRNIVTF
jgi:hypothetical protein